MLNNVSRKAFSIIGGKGFFAMGEANLFIGLRGSSQIRFYLCKTFRKL